MSDHTGIEWTDATWNPTTGCTKVSPACAHCYIERTPPFRMVGNRFVKGKTDISIFHDRLAIPLRWRKPRRIFVNSLSDLFHEDIGDAFIDRVFAVMALCPQHTFQVLTKRSERMRAYLTALTERLGELWDLTNQPTWVTLPAGRSFPRYPENWPLPNVWLGVSVENQHFADERIPLLLQTPAAVRFISAEPLLGAVDLSAYFGAIKLTTISAESITETSVRTKQFTRGSSDYDALLRRHESGVTTESPRLDWVIAGGESGPKARPSHPDWFRSLRDQCQSGGVAFHFKQHGEHEPVCALYGDDQRDDLENGRGELLALDRGGYVWQDRDGQPPPGTWLMERVGKKAAGRLLDGREWNEFPAVRA